MPVIKLSQHMKIPNCHDRSRPLASVMGWAGGAPRVPWGCVGIELVEVKVAGFFVMNGVVGVECCRPCPVGQYQPQNNH